MAAQQPSNEAIEKDIHVSGELAQTIDLRKARVGDKVSVRLTENIAIHGKIYPSGKIFGYIKRIQLPTPDNQQAELVFVLDEIKLKGKAEEPIVGIIEYIAPPAPPVITRVSGVPSPGDPMIRAAGPMVDSNGRPVSQPEPARVEPMPKITPMGQPAEWKEIHVAPNYVTHETVVMVGKKLRLVKESRVSLLLNGPDRQSAK